MINYFFFYKCFRSEQEHLINYIKDLINYIILELFLDFGKNNLID